MKLLKPLSKLALITGLLIQSPAQAVDFVFGLGLSGGGDTIMTLNYTDGTTEDMNAGDGVDIYGGLRFPISDSSGIETRIGYFFDSPSVQNGTVETTRTTMDALLYIQGERIYIAGGLTRHSNISFSCNVTSICNSTIDFEDANGFKVEIGMRLGGMTIGLRANQMDYTIVNGGTGDASNVGLFISN